MELNSIEKSDEFTSLNDSQRRNFQRKILLFKEIFDNVDNFINSKEKLTSSVLDDIELDSYSFISLGDPSERVSPYIIHSSWTIYCDKKELQESISLEIIELKKILIPGAQSSEEEIVFWCEKWCAASKKVISFINAGNTFGKLVGAHMCINYLVCVLLSLVTMLRMNSKIN